MNEFVKHHPCPKCGSRDNLAEYNDHFWCFGCGYWKSKESYKFVKIENKTKQIVLPVDIVNSIPKYFKDWLDKYELTDSEIYANRISYSPSKDMLIFPIYNIYGNLLMWQGRKKEGKPKYYTEGYPEFIYHILGKGDELILTEDLISAIKVSRVTAAMPLWGSHIAPKRIRILLERFSRLGIWLDMDKLGKALKINSGEFKGHIRVIASSQDPKCYSTDEIKDILYYE